MAGTMSACGAESAEKKSESSHKSTQKIIRSVKCVRPIYLVYRNRLCDFQLGISQLSPTLLKMRYSPTPSPWNGSFRGLSSSRQDAPALPCGNTGLAQDLGGHVASWEGGEMAAATCRGTVFGVAGGWRRVQGLRAGSLGCGSLGCRGLTVAAAPASHGSPWRLLGAVCLQRPPLVSKALTPLQEEMAAVLQQVGLRCGFWVPWGTQQRHAGLSGIPTLAPGSSVSPWTSHPKNLSVFTCKSGTCLAEWFWCLAGAP